MSAIFLKTYIKIRGELRLNDELPMLAADGQSNI